MEVSREVIRYYYGKCKYTNRAQLDFAKYVIRLDQTFAVWLTKYATKIGFNIFDLCVHIIKEFYSMFCFSLTFFIFLVNMNIGHPIML